MAGVEPSTLPVRRARSNPVRAAWRLSLILLFSASLAPFYIIRYFCIWSRAGRYRLAVAWTRFWARSIARILGLEVVAEGPPPPPGALMVANHISYLDIAALASARACFFTPKAEIRAWPIVGWLCSLTAHPFVHRVKSKGLIETGRQIQQRLDAGTCVCVFLEGTTTGGDQLLPFKPSFLQPAVESGGIVTPVGLRYEADDPSILISEDVAYWKDHVFGPHLWRLAGLKRMRVRVRMGEPIRLTPGTDRRALAERLRAEVANLAGLPLEIPGPSGPALV